MMNKLALYVFPLGVVVGGPFLPLAIILYWFANNIWTFGQQHYVFGMIEKEDEAKKQEVLQRRAANAPAPGAKPKRTQSRRRRPERIRGRNRVRGGRVAGRGDADSDGPEVKEKPTTKAPQTRRTSRIRPAGITARATHAAARGAAQEAQTLTARRACRAAAVGDPRKQEETRGAENQPVDEGRESHDGRRHH